MSLNYYEYREIISNNLIAFIRAKGYSKLSLSKLTGISRPTIDQILKGESPNQTIYNSQIAKINETFDLPEDYLITAVPVASTPPPLTYAYSDHGNDYEKSDVAKEALFGLDSILDVYSMYLNK